MNNQLSLIGRETPLFESDLAQYGEQIRQCIANSRFLIIGGAGSIGSAVVRELFAAQPKCLHVVDLSENNLVEVVRDIRSSMGYIDGDFATFAIDCLSPEFETFVNAQSGYDYVLNFSALKHVRSEKDPYTLMRLIRTNVFGTMSCVDASRKSNARKMFCVSTDKASNPVNMMGASKRIMELFLNGRTADLDVSTARFANVAFSDGSLLHGFRNRILKRQPLAAPNDVRRYFVTDKEGAWLCLFSTILGNDGEVFFPKLDPDKHLVRFSDIAERFLDDLGYQPIHCETEQEARDRCRDMPTDTKEWPCVFFASDTTGEKDFEEFYMEHEPVDWDRFAEIGVVKPTHAASSEELDHFENSINNMIERGSWTKEELVKLFLTTLPSFEHEEKNRYLDQKM